MPDECVNTQTYGYGLCLCDEESFVCECQPCRLCDSDPFCAGHTPAEWDAHCRECPLCAEERGYEGEVNFLFHPLSYGGIPIRSATCLTRKCLIRSAIPLKA